jgi:hypothetical protein
MVFIILTFIAVWALMTLWEGAGLYVIIVFVVSMLVLMGVISYIEDEISKKLVVKRIRANAINRMGPPGALSSYRYLVTYHMVCPFCNYLNAIDQTNLPGYYPVVSICIHYREMTTSVGNVKYAKFVNLKNMNP